eukprot:gnl/Chilomastix_cuspidata/2758.p2 GENE.gnl/Chilomastix_cuspidata/2758~~gnl/Chilomastix_cuspidata/2758.p2  ORF type:complete len:632 (+),score=273.14 gnl/Chilomastix_cuspidata/2758:5974-7869(+)
MQIRQSDAPSPPPLPQHVRDAAKAEQATEKTPLSVLQNVFKLSEFRPHQKKAIDSVMKGHNCLVLLPTGGGKSFCYQIPALCKPGMAIVVSPLIALMQDQVSSLRAKGIPAAALSTSLTPGEKAILLKDLGARKPVTKLLYVSPEGLQSTRVQAALAVLGRRGLVSLVAVDEAHCVSEWGHAFRPHYRRIAEIRQFVGSPPFLALTATATPEVRRDIAAKLQFGRHDTVVASFNRPNIEYHFRSEEYIAARGKTKLADLVAILSAPAPDGRGARAPRREQTGIVYCFRRQTTEEVSVLLQRAGLTCTAYHAGVSLADRRATLRAWQRGTVRLIVATVAFGMGIDKDNVRYVVHWDPPKSIEAFYQGSGRAGRDGRSALSVTYYSMDSLRNYAFLAAQSKDQPRVLQDKVKKLGALMTSARCRRAALLEYFGEHLKAARPHTTPGVRCCDFCQAPQLVRRMVDTAMRGAGRPHRAVLTDVRRDASLFRALKRRGDDPGREPKRAPDPLPPDMRPTLCAGPREQRELDKILAEVDRIAPQKTARRRPTPLSPGYTSLVRGLSAATRTDSILELARALGRHTALDEDAAVGHARAVEHAVFNRIVDAEGTEREYAAQIRAAVEARAEGSAPRCQ